MKAALILIVLIGTPTLALAQGTVVFENGTGLVKQWDACDSGLTSVPTNGGYVELMYARPGTALVNTALTSYSSLAAFLAANPGWTVGSSATIIGAGPGLFNGGTLTLAGIPGGGDAEYVIIGWTGNYPTYEAAYAAYMCNPACVGIGLSAMATTATGDPLAAPPVPPVSLRVRA